MKNILLSCLVFFCYGYTTAQTVFERQLLQDSIGSISRHFQIDYDNDGDEDLLVFGYQLIPFLYTCSRQLKWWENENNSLNYKGLSFCRSSPILETHSDYVFTAKINNSVFDELVVNRVGPYFTNFFRTYHYDISTDSTISATFYIDEGYANQGLGDVRAKDYNFVDLNNDGHDDVFKKHYSLEVYEYYINSKNGTFSSDGIFIDHDISGTLEFDLDSIILPSTGFRFFDLDGNGTEDWVFKSQESQSLYWMSNTGDINFENVQLLQSFSDTIAENWFKDIDQDGDLDLIVNRIGVGIESFKNDGAGNFTYDHLIYSSNSTLFEIADLDSDGFTDIVISPEIQSADTVLYKTIWLKNNYHLSYTEFLIDNRKIPACRFAFVNGDNKLDIVDMTDLGYSEKHIYYYSNSTGIDTITPTAICNDSVIVYLDENGEFTLQTYDLDNGSSDNVGVSNYSIEVEPYDCTNPPASLLATLNVFDFAGNSDFCTIVIEVLDTIPPTIVCKDSSVILAYGDSITITASELVTSSSDNCFVDEIQSSQTVFQLLDINCYAVELIAIDNFSNESTCTSQVCISDPATSVNLNYGVSISVFPNPTSSFVEINLSQQLPFNYDIALIDMSGRIVFQSKNVNRSNFQIDCNNLSKGIYRINMINSIDKSVVFNQSIAIH